MNTNSVIGFREAAHQSPDGRQTLTFAAELYVLPWVKLPLSRQIKPDNVRRITAAVMEELEESLVTLADLGFDVQHFRMEQSDLQDKAERLAPGCLGAKAAREAKLRVDAVAYSRIRRLGLLLNKASEERSLTVIAAQKVADVQARLLLLKDLTPRKFRWRGKRPDDDETIRTLTFVADPASHLESALRQVQSARRLFEQGEREEALALIETLSWVDKTEEVINEFVWKHQALEIIDCDAENLNEPGKETK